MRESQNAAKQMRELDVFALLRAVSSGSLAASSTAGTPRGKENTGGVQAINRFFKISFIFTKLIDFSGVGLGHVPNAQH